MLIELLIFYAFNAIVVYTYTESFKTALIWPYTLVTKGLFNVLIKDGRITYLPVVGFIGILILVMIAFASHEGLLSLIVTYLFTLFVVNTNIRNLPESLLWPFIVLKFVFGKIFAGFRRKKT